MSSVNVSSAWKALGQVWAKVSSSWKTGSLYAKQSGVWEIVAGDVITLEDTDAYDSAVGSPAAAGYQLCSNGAVQVFQFNAGGTVSVGNWISPQVNMANYTIRAHMDSGTTPSGDALDSDMSLSTTRGWNLAQASPGTVACSLTLTLKDLGGTTIDTATVTIQAQ